jgi:hypothetical protein
MSRKGARQRQPPGFNKLLVVFIPTCKATFTHWT